MIYCVHLGTSSSSSNLFFTGFFVRQFTARPLALRRKFSKKLTKMMQFASRRISPEKSFPNTRWAKNYTTAKLDPSSRLKGKLLFVQNRLFLEANITNMSKTKVLDTLFRLDSGSSYT
jgi:hypothetical protein